MVFRDSSDEDVSREWTAYAYPKTGVSVSNIHVFGWGGTGLVNSVELTINPGGCEGTV